MEEAREDEAHESPEQEERVQLVDQEVEQEGEQAFAAIKVAAAPLGDAGQVPQGDAHAAWREAHKADVVKVQQAALDLNDRLPTAMGTARARELLESYGIADVPWDVPKAARGK